MIRQGPADATHFQECGVTVGDEIFSTSCCGDDVEGRIREGQFLCIGNTKNGGASAGWAGEGIRYLRADGIDRDWPAARRCRLRGR